MGIIILLNGVSSVGKSSIADVLQNKLTDKFVTVGFDHAVENLDKKYWPSGSHEKEGFYFDEVKTANGCVPELKHGEIGEKFLETMMTDIIQLANGGMNLIFDQVVNETDYKIFVEKLHNCKIFHVGIKASIEQIISREKERGDRKAGIAASMYNDFYKNRTFDLEINTTTISPDLAADKIIDLLRRKRWII